MMNEHPLDHRNPERIDQFLELREQTLRIRFIVRVEKRADQKRALHHLVLRLDLKHRAVNLARAIHSRRLFAAQAPSDRSRLNINLRFECAVNGAFVRDFEQPRPLFRIECPGEVNLPLDPVDLAFLRLAIPAIRRVDLRMSKIHRHTFERPFFALAYMATVIDVHEPSAASNRS